MTKKETLEKINEEESIKRIDYFSQKWTQAIYCI